MAERSYYMEHRYKLKCQRLEKIIEEKDRYIKKILASFEFKKPKVIVTVEKRGRPVKYRRLRRI